MKFELFPLGILPLPAVSSVHLEKQQDQLSSDGSSKSGAMPIERLQIYGNQLSQQRPCSPTSPHPPATATTLRRYEFIRRSLTRGEKPCSPTFVIEGRKVTHKPLANGETAPQAAPQTLESFDDHKLDFDPIAFLESKMSPLKSSKMPSPAKLKAEGVQPAKGTSTSVILPILHIEGPGFSHQQRSKSSSLPGDDQPAEMEDLVTEPPAQPESIWSELENLDQRHHRSIKKNNFFIPAGTRIGENHSELCVENSHKSKTITLNLPTSTPQEKQKPPSTAAPPNTCIPGTANLVTKHSKSPRDKLYRSATHIPSTSKGSRPMFCSVSSYLNYNNKRPGLYSSEQYLDSSRLDTPLKPLDNQLKRPISRKLVAKYSDMEIQRELKDFFKVRSVR